MVNTLFADDWPQWLGPNRDAVWRESGIVENSKRPAGPLASKDRRRLRWASVARGRVYVADRQPIQAPAILPILSIAA